MMATMGGTAIESWMSAELLYGPNGTDPADGACPANPADPSTAIPANSFSPPTSNFNGQISPLFSTAVAGVLWYQGESNEVIGMGPTYACRFGKMIEDWRYRWKEGTAAAAAAAATANDTATATAGGVGDLPVGYVQIGTDCGPSEHTFATRLGQSNNNAGWDNTFMAVALDLPNTVASGAPAGGVHLMDKRTIAERLLVGALSTAAAAAASSAVSVPAFAAGPRLVNAWVTPSPAASMRGTRVVLNFTSPTGTLALRSALGFELNSACGWGGTWVPSPVVASHGTTLTIESASLIKADAVRYAHHDTPCPYLGCAVCETDPIAWHAPRAAVPTRHLPP